jgi:hypothetical protein
VHKQVGLSDHLYTPRWPRMCRRRYSATNRCNSPCGPEGQHMGLSHRCSMCCISKNNSFNTSEDGEFLAVNGHMIWELVKTGPYSPDRTIQQIGDTESSRRIAEIHRNRDFHLCNFGFHRRNRQSLGRTHHQQPNTDTLHRPTPGKRVRPLFAESASHQLQKPQYTFHDWQACLSTAKATVKLT